MTEDTTGPTPETPMGETYDRIFTLSKDPADVLVRATIASTLLPRFAYLLDTALTCLQQGTQMTPQDKVDAQRLLPAYCDNAFKGKK